MAVIQSICANLIQKAIVASCGTIVFVLIGENVLAYQILFILVAIDFTTGAMLAFYEKKLNSRASARTAYKLLLYILLVIAAHQLTRYYAALVWFEDFLVIFLAITEMISIIENATGLGVPFPLWVKEKLRSYYSKSKQ